MKTFYFCLALVSFCFTNAFADTTVQDGILDLRDKDLSELTNIKLDGEWDFYWMQLLYSNDFVKNPNLVKEKTIVPGDWNEKTVDKQKFSYIGYATYRSIILLDTCGQKLAIKISNLSSASRLYVDGNLLFEAGKVGTNKSASAPGYKPGVYSFVPVSDTVEIIFQISNFHHARGGYWYNYTRFGTEENIRKADHNRTNFNFFLVGALLLFSVFMITIFIQNSTFAYTIYFSFVCIAIAIRSLVIDDILILEVFPHIPWHLIIRLDYFTMPFGIIAFLLFFLQYFPKEFNKIVLKSLIIYGVILIVFLFVTPTIVFTKFINAYLIHFFISLVYVVFVIIKAFIKKREGALVFLIGLSVVLYAFTNDLLYNKEIINTGYKASFGFMGFFAVMIYMVSSKYCRNYSKTVSLSKNLEILNNQLEQRVTDRTKKIEEQNSLLNEQKNEIEKINETKDKFFAILAHDLRNPIGAIYQVSELLLSQIDNYTLDELKEYLIHIHKASGETSDLLENLLQWALLQKGGLELSPTTFSISQIISKNILLLKGNSRQKNIKIKPPVNSNLECYADEKMITVVVRNLIHNAIKFSPDNSVIDINAEIIGDSLRISVKDRGIGIAKEQQDLLFKVKNKKHAIGNSTESGTGLGLVLCKEFVELNKGEIWVESELNQGACFYFTIPITYK